MYICAQALAEKMRQDDLARLQREILCVGEQSTTESQQALLEKQQAHIDANLCASENMRRRQMEATVELEVLKARLEAKTEKAELCLAELEAKRRQQEEEMKRRDMSLQKTEQDLRRREQACTESQARITTRLAKQQADIDSKLCEIENMRKKHLEMAEALEVRKAKLRMTELEANFARKLRIPIHIENPRSQVIFGMREELEFWRQGWTRSQHLMSRYGCDNAHFLEDPTLIAPLQRLLRATSESHNREACRCRPMSRASIQRVLRVVNPYLWKGYAEKVEQLSECSPKPISCSVAMELLRKECFAFGSAAPYVGATYWTQLDETANEMLLFHGTHPSKAESIASTGFDSSRAWHGLYGKGFYFACKACKSYQYSGRGGWHCIVVTRVALGRANYTKTPLWGDATQALGCDADSIVALPGSQGGPPGQNHHEFVVFDKFQAFPEFIVFFDVQVGSAES